MTDNDDRLIRNFLDGEVRAMQIVDTWIEAATSGFRTRLHQFWDDLLQDIRTDLLRRFRAGEFRGEASLKTYVWRVSVHAAISRLRRESHRSHQPLEATAAPPAAAESALESLLRHEQGLAALRILDEVATPCRDLFRQLLAGRTYSQLSEESGLSEVALRVRLLRCRQQAKRLRERLNAISSPAAEPSRHH